MFSICFVHTSLKMFVKNSAAKNTSAAKFFLPLALVDHSINVLSIVLPLSAWTVVLISVGRCLHRNIPYFCCSSMTTSSSATTSQVQSYTS